MGGQSKRRATCALSLGTLKMARSVVVKALVSHALAAIVGSVLTAFLIRNMMSSALSTNVALGYSAESVRLAINSAGATEAEQAVRKHMAFLDEVRSNVGDSQFFSERMRVLSALAVRRAQGDKAADPRLMDEALNNCRQAKLTRCAPEDLRRLGELTLGM
jgi:hypothetical protein